MNPIEGSRRFPDDVLPPEGNYNSREELHTAINAWAAPRGYAFTSWRSSKTSNQRIGVIFGCDRGGYARPSKNPQRQTVSRRTGCLFSVMAKESRCGTIWSLRHRSGADFKQHNHEPSFSQVAHPIHRQLSSLDQSTVQQLSSAGVAPKGIMSYLRMNSDTIATQQDIYNCIAQGKRNLAKGQSNMHALNDQLKSEGFWSQIRLDESSRVTAVLFAHPASLAYLKLYPEVLILDCTYKTNKYKMPLLDIVGVDACQRSFCIAFAFLSGEEEHDFIWALERLRYMYELHGEALPSHFHAMEPFIYLETYRIPVCKKCEFACVSNEVPTHLQTRHRDIPPTERRRVAEVIGSIPGVIKDQSGLEEFQFPPPTINEVPFLTPPKPDGLKCRKCPYIVKHLKKIKAHCHGCQHWKNPKSRGRPRQIGSELEVELPWREEVLCQRFFPSRRASGWFEVGRKTAGYTRTGTQTRAAIDDSSARSQLNPETRAHLREVLEREQKYQYDEKQPRVYGKALGDNSFAGTSLWLERTRWPIIYNNVRRDILLAMTRIPSFREIDFKSSSNFVLGQGPRDGDGDVISSGEDEMKISCVLGAVDLMLDRCELTVQNTSRLLRCWLPSANPTSYQPKPFALMAEPNTRKKYRLIWKRFISFVLRGYLMPATLREQELRISLSPNVLQRLERLWEHRVWELIDSRQGKWPEMSETVDDSCQPYHCSSQARQHSTCSYEDMPHHDLLSSMDDSSSMDGIEGSDAEYEDSEEEESEGEFEEWLADATHEGASVATPDSTVNVLSGRQDILGESLKEFLELLFQVSIALSTERFLDGDPGSTLLVYFSGVLGFSTDCRQFRLARQYCPYLSGLIYVQRLLFLEYALPLCPYPSLGIRQRPSTQQLECLNKVRQEYMVAGSPSSFAELHSLRNFGHRIARTEPPTFFLHWSDDGQRVSIKDDMTNTQPGYSFVLHPENKFEDMYKVLLVRSCTTRTARLSRNGQWRWAAVASYLKSTAKLEEMIGGSLLTACGQAPRLLELLSLTVENSPSAIRGIFVWNKSVVYTVRHHKAKRSTNQEFYVVRFLPSRLAIIALKYLVCIRRLANLLRREQFGQSDPHGPLPSKQLLFQHHGKAWVPSRLTAILKSASKQVWNREVSARMYRQLAIGITEKHVQEVHSPFNRYDDLSSKADPNVVFAWQSGHRPLQRGITYGLDGAYPHQLQPSLLRAYEWASIRWHEFIHQASKSLPTVGGESQTTTSQYTGAASTRAANHTSRNDHGIRGHSVIRKKPINIDKDDSPRRSVVGPLLDSLTHQAVRLEGLAAILPEYRVLVCLICKTAVRPGEAIESHFRRQHFLKGDKLKAVKTLHSGWLLLDPAAMAPMDNESQVIPELAVQHGFSCKACIYLTISRDNLLKHCCQRHPELAKSGGRNHKEVSLQTWMKGKFVQYWTVLDG
ncbi:hypothetical protein MRS44_018340 [Fusarium solani]|uniref:uncharacterized protein n=1 Tax=Fusarium solani TaxID=169388 RepID=UPI0032C3DE35|nr:hypothetical protein MRS44_018340 [Fusarium solani]